MFDGVKGFLACFGLPAPEKIETITFGNNMWMVDRRLHKFKKDEVLQKDGGDCFFLDGYVYNKTEICQSKGSNVWHDAFIKLLRDEKSPKNLRGAFCGFWEAGAKVTLFVDHVGNRGLYYYFCNNILIIASNFYFIIELLRNSHIALKVSEQAARYMLEQGFMLDDTTFAEEIKRVCPGEIVEIQSDKGIERKRYYLIDNTMPNYHIGEKEIIDKIDFYFRQAIRREFDKDKEKGYKHLVDLSGGLDSRMVCWCAHEMGYTEQINFTVSRKGYLDYKIAQEISLKFKHTFFYMPMDDFQWYKEVDEILRMNNGAALYSGITGGNRFLRSINSERLGIEHTGMVGDAILSTFYGDEDYNYGKPIGNENAYSQLVKYSIPPQVLSRFENREQFSIYTRGLLGAQSSYFIRQNYVETSSPFLDVDFLNFVFTIPFKYRRRHYIYLKWIAEKYPEAANYGWEKWFGIKPKLSNLWWKRVVNTTHKYLDRMSQAVGHHSGQGMNPIDYWLNKDPEMQKWIDGYFGKNKRYLSCIPNLEKDMIYVFEKGNGVEKTQVVTALIMAKYVSGK